MAGKIVRRREGKGEKISLPVSLETKEKWNEVEKALSERGFKIDTDQAVRRIIRSLEVVLNPGRPKRTVMGPEAGQ